MENQVLNDDIKTLGIQVISKIAIINYLATMELTAKDTIVFQKNIGSIETGLWNLIRLGMEKEEEKFNELAMEVKAAFEFFLAKTVELLEA